MLIRDLDDILLINIIIFLFDDNTKLILKILLR